jgi:homoserine dehydrogenase
MSNIAEIIIAIAGSGGLATTLTVILSSRKYKAEARTIEEQAHSARVQMEQEMTERIHQQFADLAERFKQDSEEQRAQNKKLEKKITQLNNYVNTLTNWIMTENASYRAFLENEIRKTNPSFVFPKTKPVPEWEENGEFKLDNE